MVEGLIDLDNYDESTQYYTSSLLGHGLVRASLITVLTINLRDMIK